MDGAVHDLLNSLIQLVKMEYRKYWWSSYYLLAEIRRLGGESVYGVGLWGNSGLVARNQRRKRERERVRRKWDRRKRHKKIPEGFGRTCDWFGWKHVPSFNSSSDKSWVISILSLVQITKKMGRDVYEKYLVQEVSWRSFYDDYTEMCFSPSILCGNVYLLSVPNILWTSSVRMYALTWSTFIMKINTFNPLLLSG